MQGNQGEGISLNRRRDVTEIEREQSFSSGYLLLLIVHLMMKTFERNEKVA